MHRWCWHVSTGTKSHDTSKQLPGPPEHNNTIIRAAGIYHWCQKSYNTSKQSQHDKCNGVIDGTIYISIILLCMCQTLTCPSNAKYMLCNSCIHEATMSVYIPHMNSINQQCDRRHWCTYTSYYWHMPLNKYACIICYIALSCTQ